MRRRLLVIVAAVMLLSCGPLRAMSLDDGGKPQNGGGPLAREPASPQRPPVARRPAETVDAAAKASIKALDLQSDFPKDADQPGFKIPVPEELIWIALACALALLLYSLRDSLPFLRRHADAGWETAGDGAVEAARHGATDALAAAEALSRDGRFVEAMHMLLLQSLVEIRQQLNEQFADSLTSREILRGVRLPAQGRTSFRDIVTAVERTYFGGYPAARDNYAACRRSFDSLRIAMRGAPQ